MADVVLDETEWVRAILADTDRGDLGAARLVACIQQHHRWILTPSITAKYRNQYKSRVRGPAGPTALEMIKSFTAVLSDSRRCIQPDEDPPTVEGDYHRKDQHIVSAAAWVRGSVVVTSDRKLTNQLAMAELPRACGFQLLNTREAIVELCPEHH